MNKKTFLAIFVIVVIIILAFVAVKYSPKNKNVESTPIDTLNMDTSADTTGDIDNSLNSIDTSTTTDSQLQDLDKDLNTL